MKREDWTRISDALDRMFMERTGDHMPLVLRWDLINRAVSVSDHVQGHPSDAAEDHVRVKCYQGGWAIRADFRFEPDALTGWFPADVEDMEVDNDRR